VGICKEFVPFSLAHTSDWRNLRVDVRSKAISVYWGKEEEFIGSLAGSDWLKVVKNLRVQRPFMEGIHPEFSPEGGVGLFLEQGGGSFRNVSIEPIED
jgi:hypothetical protein